MTWLDGASEGEQRMEAFVDIAMASGAAALNVIPDRNYAPSARTSSRSLYDVVALAERRGFPVIAGTEMNAPGQKFVDTFSSDELKPLAPTFLQQRLHRLCAYGAAARVRDRLPQPVGEGEFLVARSEERFLRSGGSRTAAGRRRELGGVDADVSPKHVLARLH